MNLRAGRRHRLLESRPVVSQRISDPAVARMCREPPPLQLDRINKLGLPRRSGSEFGVEWAEVTKATIAHLVDLLVMASIECGEPAAPAHCLGVAGVPALACRKDRPDCMQLAVLPEQMLVAQFGGIEIPDTHTHQPSDST
jgi:hypothetical protein